MRQANNQGTVPSPDIFPITEEGPIDLAETNSVSAPMHTVQGYRTRAREKARQAARIKRLLLACLFSCLYLVALTAFYSQSLVSEATLTTAIIVVAGAMALFCTIFFTGLDYKTTDRNLTVPFMLCAIGTMLWIVYRAPDTRIVFAPFMFVTVAYGMYRVPQKNMLQLGAATLLGYLGIIGLHYLQRRDAGLLQREFLHCFVLMLTLPGFVILAGRVQHLHDALHKAGVKIRSIEENARRDSLTDCYNRRYMVAALEDQKRIADENGMPLCLAVIDLDHFKRINDEIGHLAGDEVLRTFARIAQGNVRQSDIFGRYGGEEFLLILPETPLLAALNTAERIREQVENHAWAGKLHGLVTVSIGLTQYISGESVLDLFSRTDTAMYLAKRGGRNQVVVEEPATELWQHAPAQ